MNGGKRRKGRKALFWLTVAGVAVVADLAVHHSPNLIRSPGLARLTQHMGGR